MTRRRGREPRVSIETEFPPGRWRARWIWCAAPDIVPGAGGMPVRAPDAAPRTALFRRTFQLDKWPPPARAGIVADGRYVLWVNGVEAARGPVRGNPRRLRCDLVDLSPPSLRVTTFWRSWRAGT